MKLLGHRPGLPGNVTSFYIVPLDPVHSARLAGQVPAKRTILFLLGATAATVSWLVQWVWIAF
jgi:hypothetical protein